MRSAASALGLVLFAACHEREATPPVQDVEVLRRERDALHERLEKALAEDPVVRRVFTEGSSITLALRTQFVTDLVAEVAHQYLDDVVVDLSSLHASADGEVRPKTFLGRIKVGEWRVDADVENLRGSLRAGHPRLGFEPGAIRVALPVNVRQSPGRVALRFSWDASGLANAVCDDFQVERELQGLVLAQRHQLAGTVRVTAADGLLRVTPVFENRTVDLRVDLAAGSWATLDLELRAQDSLGRCGLLLDPAAVMGSLRELAARGIRVKLPEEAFRSFDLPARLSHDVTLGERKIGVFVRRATFDVGSDLLWSGAEVAADVPASTVEGGTEGGSEGKGVPPGRQPRRGAVHGHAHVDAKGGTPAGQANP